MLRKYSKDICGFDVVFFNIFNCFNMGVVIVILWIYFGLERLIDLFKVI